MLTLGLGVGLTLEGLINGWQESVAANIVKGEVAEVVLNEKYGLEVVGGALLASLGSMRAGVLKSAAILFAVPGIKWGLNYFGLGTDALNEENEFESTAKFAFTIVGEAGAYSIGRRIRDWRDKVYCSRLPSVHFRDSRSGDTF